MSTLAPSLQPTDNARATTAVLEDLRGGFLGDIYADRLHRALYSTDASIFEIEPDVVLMPRTVGDVRKAVRVAAQHGIPITARGGGTGLTGGAVNRGLQLDCSRYFNRILAIDPEKRTAVVEPGVVLDHLNAAVAPHGLYFAPDVAPSSRATIGGMIANNSCGAHSVSIGRTVDHVLGLDVVLGDGGLAHFGAHRNEAAIAPLQHQAEATLRDVLTRHATVIEARYPKVLRSNGGYGLDRLRISDETTNAEAVLCGSEGTLGIVTKATLNLLPIPKRRGLVVLAFDELLAALAAVPNLLETTPAAIELVDKLILSAARKSSAFQTQREFAPANAAAILVVECYADSDASLTATLTGIEATAHERTKAVQATTVTNVGEQAAVWNMRNAGLGLLMSKPGAEQPYAFVEDSAVPPAHLRDYIERFAAILSEEGVAEAGYYAHASVGCLHVRPVLNLGNRGDVERMRRIADRISSLALEFGGAMTGEHGDGLLRSEWLAKTYGPELMAAFKQIKRAFDPHGIFNPGKIVDAPPMNQSLRRGYGTLPPSQQFDTTLDFSKHGGMLGLARMCSGVGQCRQTQTGTMCPSYMATRDERHTTRGRANALRHALTDSRLIENLSDPALDDVMDLCLSCKACKTECPTNVDMARLKAEWQHQKNERDGASLRSKLIANSPDALRLAMRWPRAANFFAQARIGRQLSDFFIGIDQRVAPPRLAAQTFRDWFSKRPSANVSTRQVVYFVDTWTDCITPNVGKSVVKILERLGWQVLVPRPMCCGRPAISQGLLNNARQRLTHVSTTLAPFIKDDLPIIASEPSCWSALKDELPQLVLNETAVRLSQVIQAADAFVLEQLHALPPSDSDNLFTKTQRSIHAAHSGEEKSRYLLHGHCHQKAMSNTQSSLGLLRMIADESATEINSGCCGMAGAFGHEREHYDVARLIGADRLFPAIENALTARIAVTGFSCRHQIEHHTKAKPRHVLEWVADALNTSAAH